MGSIHHHCHQRFLLALAWAVSTVLCISRDTYPLLLNQIDQSQQTNSSIRRREQSSTCSIDGVTYQAGDNLGNAFVTRCGPASEWPCYCSPLRDPPVECPYCAMADVDRGLVCAKDGETVSVFNLNGISQSCSCSVAFDGTPQETCEDENDENDNDHGNRDDEFCTIQIYNGTTMRFENGESLGELLPTRCPGGGSVYPCYCNTALADQVECPYCTWLDYRGDLMCARQAESITFENAPGEYLECACLSGLISTCKPMAPSPPPVGTPPPTMSPTSFQEASSPSGKPTPTSTMFFSPSASPTTDTTGEPTISPTQTSSTGQGPTTFAPSPSQSIPFDKDSLIKDDRPPLSEPDLGGCLYLNETSGLVEFVEEGATFGPNLHGPCSPNEEWPVICNPAIPNGGMEYPYCVFSGTSSDTVAAETRAGSSANSSSDSVVCARTEERVDVLFEDGSTEECSCLYFNPLLGPSSSCPMVPVNLVSPSFSPGKGGPSPPPMTQSTAPPNNIGEVGGNPSSSSSTTTSTLIPPVLAALALYWATTF